MAIGIIGVGLYRNNSHPVEATVKTEITESVPAADTDSVNSEDVERVINRADFATLYNSFEDLVQAADFVIEGKVLDSTSFDYVPEGLDEAVVMTKSNVQVTKSYSDSVKEGQVLTFVEPGGVTSKKALGISKKFNLSNENLNGKIQIDFNGVPAMKKHAEVLLFGVAPQSAFRVINEEHSYIVGAHQGKFSLTHGVVERAVPDHMNKEIAALKISHQDFEREIRALVLKKKIN
jgi:hypothetical protein